MATARDDPDSAAAPWSMPARFLPLPKDFSCSGSSTKTDLRSKSHSQLLALATRHNSRQGITEDPFVTALKGIPERAKLRPDSVEAATHTLGNVPADSPYAKAWRSIKRKHVRGAANKARANEEAAAKRAEAAATAARLAKLQGNKSAQELNASRKHAQQLVVPPEQVRWRSKLEAFLGRHVVVPRLGPEAPVLDMNKLFLEVMNQGGMRAVTAAGGWSNIALQLQRDADLADQVCMVYDNYLHPLEKDLPYGFRPARNVDHLEGRAQIRSSMGCRLASYDAVAYVWQHALAALEQVAPVEAQQQQSQQWQQQRSSGRQLVHAALALLRNAAVQPLSVVQQLQEHSIAPALHGPSREACIMQIRRAFASRRKGRGTAAAEVSDWDADEELVVMQKFKAENASLAELVKLAADTAKPQATRLKESRSSSPVLERQQQQGGTSSDTAAAAADVYEEGVPSAKHVKLGPAIVNSCPQGQQQLSSLESAHRAAPSARECLDAVLWMFVSLRAVRSGPPGSNKPAMQLTEIGVEIDSSVGRSIERASNEMRAGLDGKQQRPPSSTSNPGKRSVQGITPKCGSCRTCLNPSMKKACVVNRERMAQGLPPHLSGEAPGHVAT